MWSNSLQVFKPRGWNAVGKTGPTGKFNNWAFFQTIKQTIWFDFELKWKGCMWCLVPTTRQEPQSSLYASLSCKAHSHFSNWSFSCHLALRSSIASERLHYQRTRPRSSKPRLQSSLMVSLPSLLHATKRPCYEKTNISKRSWRWLSFHF